MASKMDTTILEPYGWYVVLNALSGGDVTKENQVLRLPIVQAITNYVFNSKQNYCIANIKN